MAENPGGGGLVLERTDGVLSIAQSCFTDDQMGMISQALRSNSSLQVLRLKYSELTDEDVPRLCNFFNENTSLKMIEDFYSDEKVLSLRVRYLGHGMQPPLEVGCLEENLTGLYLVNPTTAVEIRQTYRYMGNVPLPAELMAILENNRADLVTRISPNSVCDYLRQWKTLTEEDEERIKHKETTAEQVRQLLDILRRKSLQAYWNFKKALLISNQEHIERLLSEEEQKAGLF